MTVYGELNRVRDRWQLRFTRSLPHSPEKVWRSITQAEHLAAWFPAEIHGERAVGARLTFVFANDEGPTTEGEMLAFDPPTLLEYRWGEETLRFELEPAGDGGTRLTFVNTFDELGKAARDAAGWHTCLDVLGHHLAGEQPPWPPMERWEQVHAVYVEQLGPEAAPIGPPESVTDRN
jgi:uncharacterized protein YndB with AHSA1/START domain